MLPDRVSNPGPLTYESGALPTALRGPAYVNVKIQERLPYCLNGSGCLRVWVQWRTPLATNGDILMTFVVKIIRVSVYLSVLQRKKLA